MAKRTKKLAVRPWNGGLNTSLDPSLISPAELTTAENFIYSPAGSRKLRGGINPWGYIAIGVNRSSVDKVRTLTITVNAGVTIADTDQICIFNCTEDQYNMQVVDVDSVAASGGNKVITYTTNTDLTEDLTNDTSTRVMLLSTARIVGLFDFWYYDSSSHSKAQKIIAVRSDGTFWSYSNQGNCLPITVTSGALSTTAATAYFAALGGRLVISFDEYSNEPVIYNPATNAITAMKNLDWNGTDVTATNAPPNFSVMTVWGSRIWTNNKVNPDQILFSDIQEPERWNGEGDSGGLEFDGGDSDSSGITAIFPPFKGVLSFTKQNKLYQLTGTDPVNYKIDQLSLGLGCEAQKSAVAVDQDDIFFLSRRGFNSLITSANFGNFEAKFVSSSIQSSIIDDLDMNKRNYCSGLYMPEINSVLWSVNTGASYNNEFWLYNLPFNAWYKWISSNTALQSVTSIAKAESSLKNNIYLFGLTNGSVYKYDDSIVDGLTSSIQFRVKSGLVYVDEDANNLKAFKNIYLLLKASREDYNLDLNVKIDNHKAQYKSDSLITTGDKLGTTFILGKSRLGITPQIINPHPYDIDGYGYGISIELISTGSIESFGYIIEFENAGDQQDFDA